MILRDTESRQGAFVPWLMLGNHFTSYIYAVKVGNEKGEDVVNSGYSSTNK